MDLWALLVSSFLAATVLPLASEVPLALVVTIAGDAMVAIAGASRVPFLPFFYWTVIGKATRYAAVVWIALNA